MRITA